MAFHPISFMDVWDIIRRWHDGHSINQIALTTRCDRKTVRRHIRRAQAAGICREGPLPPPEEVLEHIKQPCGRVAQTQTLLLPYLDEIAALLHDVQLPLKPKTAFRVIVERHDLATSVSYTSYKRFLRAHKLALNPHLVTCRVEVPPGSELQVDYARIGLVMDSSVGHKRTLYAFIGTLSHSRMKYVELTFSQDQVSFVGSHIRMFEFFGGVAERIILDNLKPGVIKPDLYDPSLNRTYREMAEHYGCFIDPARVRHPKDKAKVERDVQTVREAVRMILVQNPTFNGLSELNRLIKDWSINEYGQNEHGTTHERPFTVLQERERPCLKPLPATRFDPAQWKQATVHPDHYIQFRGKAYSMPHAYVGKTLWIRATEHLLQAFFHEQLVKQHVITKAFRHTDHQDFPDNVRAVLDRSFIHRTLLDRASHIGPSFHALIRELFHVHAYINLRSAQGLVGVAETAANPAVVERATAFIREHHIKATPHNLRHLLLKLQAEASMPNLLPLSDATAEFVRDATYFIHTTNESPL